MAFVVILFIVIPIAELYVIIQVGQSIGIAPTLAILIADALLGAFLLRHQGRSAWRRFNEALDQRRFPGKEVADGVMITFGGALLLTPGFITDIAGLALLIPPSRAVIRKVGYQLLWPALQARRQRRLLGLYADGPARARQPWRTWGPRRSRSPRRPSPL